MFLTQCFLLLRSKAQLTDSVSINISSLAGLLFGELSPVCAVVGGVVAQEIIKAISNKDAPHNNYFFYNPVESCGVVETIGY